MYLSFYQILFNKTLEFCLKNLYEKVIIEAELQFIKYCHLSKVSCSLGKFDVNRKDQVKNLLSCWILKFVVQFCKLFHVFFGKIGIVTTRGQAWNCPALLFLRTEQKLIFKQH